MIPWVPYMGDLKYGYLSYLRHRVCARVYDAMLLAPHRGPPIDLDDEDAALPLTLGTAELPVTSQKTIGKPWENHGKTWENGGLPSGNLIHSY